MKTACLLLLCILACFAAPAEAAPVTTPAGHITFLSGGWFTANLRVQMDFPWTNPQSCGCTDGYMVDSADQGQELFSSMLISAFLSGKRVQFILDGFAYDRPHIIGVDLVG